MGMTVSNHLIDFKCWGSFFGAADAVKVERARADVTKLGRPKLFIYNRQAVDYVTCHNFFFTMKLDNAFADGPAHGMIK